MMVSPGVTLLLEAAVEVDGTLESCRRDEAWPPLADSSSSSEDNFWMMNGWESDGVAPVVVMYSIAPSSPDFTLDTRTVSVPSSVVIRVTVSSPNSSSSPS